MNSPKRIWLDAANILKEEMSESSFETWIKPIVPQCIKGESFILGVPSLDNKKMIFAKYYPLIESSLKTVSSKNFQIEIVTESEKKDNDFSIEEQKIENSFSFNPKYNFSTFIVGSSNNLACAASIAVSNNLARTYNPLFLYGRSGLGKTHLLHAIANQVKNENNGSKKIIYTTSEKFTYELVNSIKTETNQVFRNKYREADLVLIDDIQFFTGRERTQEEFFHTFNALFAMEKQIVLASDRLPSEIAKLEERLVTRFSMGLIADVQPPDYETRIAILKDKLEDKNLVIDNAILEYIAENIKSNVRDLEGAVKRLLACAEIQKIKNITIDFAIKALNELAKSNNKKEISIFSIIETVEKYYKLSNGSLISQKKSKDLAFPRQIAMFIAREITEQSLPAIGQNFGGRDHSTVIHAVNKIKNLMQNEEIKFQIKEIIIIIRRI
ncbi:MAG: chromosomal replication initiator protein DnaA [Clostridiales bacterium]|jgi:chromosomal replication initiator protein|nr:chromosomal replication initiator protein DnaA [Clostridiales bacterium]